MEQTRLRFSDFAVEVRPLEGEKLPLDAVLNMELWLVGCRIKASKYEGKNKSGKYLTIQYHKEGALCVTHTGSDVLIDQMELYSNRIPFLTTIIKVGRYYTFT
jgi:hypothetical protein